jgi:hypothetical protein
VHGVRPRPPDGLDQLRDVEIALRGGAASERERLVGPRHVQRTAVGVGVHRDRSDSELAERAEHADCDLAPVRDKDLGQHAAYSLRG